jgi:DNA end-binding protein Ku
MAARAIASGTIAFGLVSIPVKLYSATRSQDVHFHMLHAADGGRLRQRYECRTCEQTVERSQMARGYEYSRDQFVVLSEEELKAFDKQSDQSIEIEEFVPISKVDPIFFEKSSLLGPDKGGSKAYHLLRDAMVKSGRVAIGRYHSRGREQLVLVRPTQEGLILHGLFYSDEVRGFDDVDLGDRTEVRDAELALAQQLIDQLSTSTFDGAKYKDEHREAVLAAIDRKVAGEEVVMAPRAEPREKIIDLVAALKQSLAARDGNGSTAAAAEDARKAPRPVARKKASRRKAESR